MSQVFVSIGSNIDKEKNLRSCVKALQQTFRQCQLSSVYQSGAIGFEGDDFYNMVVSFETTLSPKIVNDVLLAIETQHGRVRGKNRFVSRELDLDQLLYDDLVLNENGVCLPRAEITQHAFILKPTAELAAHKVHPSIGKSFAELWNGFDQSCEPLTHIPFEWRAPD